MKLFIMFIKRRNMNDRYISIIHISSFYKHNKQFHILKNKFKITFIIT